MQNQEHHSELKIVFFDGECHVCNESVQILLKRDASRELYYAPLRGKTFHEKVPIDLQKNLPDSILFFNGEQIYTEGNAIAQILISLGKGWRILGKSIDLLPDFLVDGVYRFVARNRYKWFGKNEECRLYSPSEQKQFLP